MSGARSRRLLVEQILFKLRSVEPRWEASFGIEFDVADDAGDQPGHGHVGPLGDLDDSYRVRRLQRDSGAPPLSARRIKGRVFSSMSHTNCWTRHRAESTHSSTQHVTYCSASHTPLPLSSFQGVRTRWFRRAAAGGARQESRWGLRRLPGRSCGLAGPLVTSRSRRPAGRPGARPVRRE